MIQDTLVTFIASSNIWCCKSLLKTYRPLHFWKCRYFCVKRRSETFIVPWIDDCRQMNQSCGMQHYFIRNDILVTIIKDKLTSINSSKNYRSISISSLVLKLIDWIILILFGDSLALDDLQFAYQPGCSTTMCTWAVVETVSYFLRNGLESFWILNGYDWSVWIGQE